MRRLLFLLRNRETARMSLIHEALQKAEAERRAGELPSLLSATGITHRQAQRSSRRWLWVLPMVVLMAALAFSNRDLLQQNRAETATASAEPPAQTFASASTKAVAAIKPAQVRMQEDSVLPGIPSGVLSTAPTDIKPVAKPRPDAPATEPVALVPPAAVALKDMPELHAHAPEPMAEPPVQTVDVPQREVAVQQEPLAKSPQESAPISRPEATTETKGVPYLFELPLATRQALPALKVTMQVYHADPAQRFAIIDGKRVNEKGVAGNELNLIEIQRDAIMFEFRGTRFLLPRLGR